MLRDQLRILKLLRQKGKNSTIIEKSKNNFVKKGSFSRSTGNISKQKSTSSFNRGAHFKPSFGGKMPQATNDFERRKLAEQRATKRLKGDTEGKKSKVGTKKGS